MVVDVLSNLGHSVAGKWKLFGNTDIDPLYVFEKLWIVPQHDRRTFLVSASLTLADLIFEA